MHSMYIKKKYRCFPARALASQCTQTRETPKTLLHNTCYELFFQMTFSFITATTLTTYSSKTYSISGVSNTPDAGLKNNFED